MSRKPREDKSLPAAVFRQIDKVCEAFEQAWRSGGRPALGSYLAGVSAEVRPVLLGELLLLDIEYRERLGERPDPGDYLSEFPHEAQVVRAAFGLAPAAPQEMQVQLDVLEGPSQGQTFLLAGHQSFLVGRSRRAHLRLPEADPFFSRVHFMIEMNPPSCALQDMGSTNGTKINGRRVQRAELRHGDLIQGGDTVLRVSFLGDWSTVTGPEAIEEPPKGDAADPGQTPTRTYCPPVEARAGSSPGESGPQAASRARPIGPPIPGYELVRPLGRGGMGIVYLAVRASDRAEVAIKTIRPAVAGSPLQVQRFLREARILEQLHHPNIVSFHQSGQAGEILYFVMDYVEGTNGSQLLKQRGPLPVERAVGLICQALEGLHFAHGKGYVHRDVKPANILVGQAGDKEICRLADFGLARAYHASPMSGLTILGDIGGTIPYMAPEQIAHYRDAKPPADQYAAAATLYHLLTGEHPFDFQECSTHLRLAKILCDEPVSLRDRRAEIPTALARVVHRALEKDPSRRFPNAASMRSALAPFAP